MIATMAAAREQARTDPRLREMSPAVRAHYDTIERRMHNRQRAWGGDVNVITPETAGRSTAIRRSLGFQAIMRGMPVSIEPHDRIVGCALEDDTIVRCAFPIFLKPEELGKCTIHMSHKCPDYEYLLEKGLRGLLDELEAAQADSDSPYEDIRASRREMAEIARIEVEGVIALAHRYADLAEAQAAAQSEPAEKARLERVAQVCRRVPEFPARSLQEALQSIWLVNFAFFHTDTTISIGNIDRITEPYFRRDWEAGKITLEEAQELVDSFCLRVNDRAQIDPDKYVVPDQASLPGAPRQSQMYYGHGFVTSAENDGADAINHWGQNILLSGLLPDGGDATSALTYLFLNAHEKLRMTSPVLSLRVHRNSPPELIDRAAEVLKTGGGMPFINNDDVIVSAYESWGVSREDACMVANSNCWETLIQGRSNQEMIRGLNFLYFLELALNRGQSFVHAQSAAKEGKPDRANPMTFSGSVMPDFRIVDGVDTGDIGRFATFDDLMQAWRTQLDAILKYSMEYVHKRVLEEGSHGPLTSAPLLSLLTRGCAESLRDTTHGGARYTLWHLMGEAVSNAADAAAAIKKFVYEDQAYTLREVVDLLRADWAGEAGEQLRQRFLHDAPKFGNGIAEADDIAVDMVAYFAERCEYHAKRHPGILFTPCIGTFSWIISIGKRMGASADGRHSQECIAANCSPMPGRDVTGPTAALHSYLQLPLGRMAAGAPIDLRVASGGLEGEAGTVRVAALIRGFIEAGGNMMTLTVTSAEELRRAMAKPEAYRGLRVRMGGWSAYYVLLSKAAQEIHLRRVEHGV